jgi:IS5 family transposase
VLVDRYAPEDAFARVPELAADTDAVLARLDRLLEDDERVELVRADLAGRYSTPAEAILRGSVPGRIPLAKCSSRW